MVKPRTTEAKQAKTAKQSEKAVESVSRLTVTDLKPAEVIDDDMNKCTVFDGELLAHVRQLWSQGDWERLTSLQLPQLEQHPERAKVCLVVASAWLQLGETVQGRLFLDQALRWGCDKALVAQVLVAGVHNTLGRASAASGQTDRPQQHFRQALLGSGKSSERMAQVRYQNEMQRTGRAFSSGMQPKKSIPAHNHAEEDDTDANFYRAFEDRFRGSRELIKERVRVYLPFVQPVAQRHPQLKALDLGCGRGEWLEVLGESGIAADGVDIDTGMLRDCTSLGLSVQEGDALSTLRQQATASRICISLIHVVEHLPFETVKQIVKEAKRVLVGDGLLIMETPNPENYTVGACNFYMDPTHRNPLPPMLLAFVPEYYGYERVKVLRLQEDPQIKEKNTFDVFDFLTKISPDYAVISQLKRVLNNDAQLSPCDDFWDINYGIEIMYMHQKISLHK